MSTPGILIVEDEQIIARGIEKRLKGLGYAVAGLASTGEEAVQRAQALRPDLILMDINLGNGIDGVEAAARIRAHQSVPVVYLTAYSDAATLQRAKLTEPFGYILKPYEDKDLQTAIELGRYKHQMEQRLRENEQWLAATLGNIGDGVIATDEDGRVRYLNVLAEELTAWTLADARGQEVEEVFHVRDGRTRARVPNPIRDALARGTSVILPANSILIDRTGKERPIDDSAAPIRTASGAISGAVLVFRDITERRRLEEQLRQAAKMEAIGRLAGGVAHDFNNLLTVINGYSEYLLVSTPPAQVREGLEQILAAGQQAAGLTRQILAYSRKQARTPVVMNLNSVLRDMCGMVVRLVGAQVEFDLRPSVDPVKVEIDPTQLGQVILNLAVNARDAMPTGGRLTITTGAEEVPPATATHRGVRSGRYVVLAVRDTGSGIAPEVLPHIFEPYFTTKEVGQGTGLGLASVDGIVQQSGGFIEIESVVGQGSTFRVFLPRVEESHRATDSTDQTLQRGNETILLVEDDDTVRRMLFALLKMAGYAVLEARNGIEGVALAQAHAGPIHLVLTDLVMPHLGGRQLADQLALSRPATRVLFMSGYTEDTLLLRGIDSGTVDFLHKPFDLTVLSAKVRAILDRSK